MGESNGCRSARVPEANPPGHSRGLTSPSSVAVDNSVRECTKGMPPPPGPFPQPTEGGKDLANHGATAAIRQDDAGTTQSLGPSQPIDKSVPEGACSDSLPREEVPRTKREYTSFDTKTLPRIASLDNSSRLTDSLNDLMVLIFKRHESADTDLDSPYWVSGWEGPLQDGIRINVSGNLVSTEPVHFLNPRFRSSSAPLPTVPQVPTFPGYFFLRSFEITWASFRRGIRRNESILSRSKWAPLPVCSTFASVLLWHPRSTRYGERGQPQLRHGLCVMERTEPISAQGG